MSLVARFKCPTCGADVSITITPELLREAAEKGVARALARRPRNQTAVLIIDQYSYICPALPVRESTKPDCEITDRAPVGEDKT